MSQERQPAGVSPRWSDDPTGRHESRFWDGQAWTAYVADSGVQTIDPPQLLPPSGFPKYDDGQVSTRTNGLAIASMVLGIVWIFWIGSVLAVIFGHVALRGIKRSAGAERGRGMALAGLVLGYLAIAVFAVSFAVGFVRGVTENTAGTSGASPATCAADRARIRVAEEAIRGISAGHYEDESTLVGFEYLPDFSDLHEVVVSPDGSSYQLIPTGDCAR
jgi:hypothetical protein